MENTLVPCVSQGMGGSASRKETVIKAFIKKVATVARRKSSLTSLSSRPGLEPPRSQAGARELGFKLVPCVSQGTKMGGRSSREDEFYKN